MSTTAVSIPASAQAPPRLAWRAWAWGVGLGLLFILVHQHFLLRMFRIATNTSGATFWEALVNSTSGAWNRDWSYTLIIPFISGYYIFQHRHQLARIPHRVFLPGLAVMLLGLASYAWWLGPGRNDMFSGYSMVIALAGLVLFLLGPASMRVLGFPIAYLVLAVKISDRIWDTIAWKLQIVAANASTVALKFLGAFLDFDAENKGSTIELSFGRAGMWVTESLNVAEACSGLRMLAAFVALSVAMAFLSERRWWQRLIMVAMAVPIAVLVNVGRVTVLGLLFIYDPESAKGSFHTFVGMLMLIPAAGLFWLLGWVLDKLIVQDEGGGGGSGSGGGEPEASNVDAAHASNAASDHAEEPMDARTPDAPRSQPSAAYPRSMAAPPAVAARRSGIGVGLGVLLVGLVAGATAMTVATIRPDLLLDWPKRITMPLASALALAALAAFYLARRLLHDERKPVTGLRLPWGGLGVVAAVLAVSLFSLTSTVEAMKVVLIKEPVPLRKSPFWSYIPREIGPYQQAGSDQHLSEELLEELGTELYLSRTFRDTRVDENKPGAFISLHVAYYTGLADTVPHVPDRCFVAGGARGVNKTGETLQLTGSRYRPDPNRPDAFLADSRVSIDPVRLPQTDIPATLFTFSPARSERTSNVVYFFSANGKFLPTPDHVRLQGFDLRDRYSYYCKIEVLLHGVADADQAVQRASEFVSLTMPEIMACLPDWTEVKNGDWPPQQGQGVATANPSPSPSPSPSP